MYLKNWNNFDLQNSKRHTWSSSVILNGHSILWKIGNSGLLKDLNYYCFTTRPGFPHCSVSKESACSAGDPGSIPGLGRSPREGNGNPLQYFCLYNPMDRGAWKATVDGVTRVGHDWATKHTHYQNTRGILHRARKKFVWNHKWPQTAKAILRKKNKAGGIILPDFKLYFRAIVIKLGWYWQKQQIHRTMEQNRKPQNKLTHKFMIKEPRNQSGKRKVFSIICFWENWTATWKRINLKHYFTPYTKINSK